MLERRREELLDVVDGEDTLVGTAERGEIHRRRLFHRAVHIFVVDDRGRLYLQRRSWSKDQYPGLWDSSASGHVDSGESYSQAARRELQEELGIDLSLEPVCRLPASEETGFEHSVLYRARLSAPGPEVRPNAEEILEGRFFEPQEIDAELGRSPGSFSPSFRLLYRLFRTHPGG
jgi:isopentenyl-diphosphate Delta-isomerase